VRRAPLNGSIHKTRGAPAPLTKSPMGARKRCPVSRITHAPKLWLVCRMAGEGARSR
jgi:hypothetical protein